MARILRGEVRWVDFDPARGSEQGGVRPIVVLSNNVFNERSGTVIGMALTSKPQHAAFPLTYELGSENLPKKSWVKVSQIRTFAVERLGKKITDLPESDLDQLLDGLNEILSA
jgi:mRNA interferase MazF